MSIYSGSYYYYFNYQYWICFKHFVYSGEILIFFIILRICIGTVYALITIEVQKFTFY